MHKAILLFILLPAFGLIGYSQKSSNKSASDSMPAYVRPVIRDSAYFADSARRSRIRRTTRHSAIIPGWGQIDNKQGWKVPIVYAGLGIPVYLFFNNVSEYKALRQAYIYRLDTIPGNDILIPEKYQPLSDNSIRYYRDEYRRNVDYSVIAFIIAWGLNVVDATVFANLKDFEVSDNLALKMNVPSVNLQPGYTQVGISFQIKNKSSKVKSDPAR